MFVCTYVARLENLHRSVEGVTAMMGVSPHGCLLAVNSNYGHACQPGREDYLKLVSRRQAKDAATRDRPDRVRPRRVQGDGTCFNSTVEPVLAIDGSAPGKVYYMKCFTTTGETQIPGVVRPDLSDGHDVLTAFVDYLNALGVGDAGPDGAPLPVVVAHEGPNMLNYKFRVLCAVPREILDLRKLVDYLRAFEACSLAHTPERIDELLAGWRSIVAPPFPIVEARFSANDAKASFRFRVAARAPRVNVFQEGKINILGAECVATAAAIHRFCGELFAANWARLVCARPRPDGE